MSKEPNLFIELHIVRHSWKKLCNHFNEGPKCQYQQKRWAKRVGPSGSNSQLRTDLIQVR